MSVEKQTEKSEVLKEELTGYSLNVFFNRAFYRITKWAGLDTEKLDKYLSPSILGMILGGGVVGIPTAGIIQQFHREEGLNFLPVIIVGISSLIGIGVAITATVKDQK